MHVIGKYFVELTAKAGDGIRMQKELQQTIEEKLFPRMDCMFNKILINDASITIDRLDLDLELTSSDDWLDKMSDKILEEIQSNILSRINHEEPGRVNGKSPNASGQSAPGSVKSRKTLTIEKFSFFLAHGYLPWWSVGDDAHLKEDEILKVFKSVEGSIAKIELIRQDLMEVLGNEQAVQRLLQQFSNSLIDSLIIFLFPEESGSIAQAVDKYILLQEQNLTELYRRQQLNEFKKELLLTAVSRNTDTNWKKFPEDYSINKNTGKMPSARAIQAKDGLTDAVSLKTDQVLQNQLPEKIIETERERLIRKLFKYQDVAPAEEIFIANAGLVIVAPFLTMLFEKLAWIKEMQLTSPTKAVYLLQYLASGNTAGMEHEFPLNKILSGMDVYEPLSIDEDLLATELEEADKVLMAILQHWRVLKNTSKQGLRESFLLRNGKLSRRENDWLLQVEQKPYDMLLDSLPWSINLIRLPFMKSTLNTEWH